MFRSNTLFHTVNHTILLVLALSCLLPFVYVLSVSLSAGLAVSSGRVLFWPVDFTWAAYEFVAGHPQFWISLSISVRRVALGCAINMLLIILSAYPLSKEPEAFRLRTAYVWFFVFTMLFHGGLIPHYLLVNKLGLLNTLWALVLPGAVPVFSVILLLNFMRGLPKEMNDSAAIDGAGEWQKLWRIYVPLSKPALATLLLFSVVGHWNAWFDGMIYNNAFKLYPLQTYLASLVVTRGADYGMNPSQETDALYFNKNTTMAAQIFLAALPMIILYPFVQKYFVKGIVMGSVKE